MDLTQFREQNEDLWPAVREWLLDGWGIPADLEITPFMVAAALAKEADTQDDCVARGESFPAYPVRLRCLAVNLATAEIETLMQKLSTVDREAGMAGPRLRSPEEDYEGSED